MPDTILRDYWSSPDEISPEDIKEATFVRKGKDTTENKISARIREYEKDFDVNSLTAADRNQIKNLARLEIGVEQLTERISGIGDASPKDAKALSATLNEMMGQSRQLASSLGIDRRSRTSRGESEYEEYLPRLHHEAYEFLAQKSIVIMCLKCAKNKSHTKINEGFIVFHFAENTKWSWDSRCPKCQETLHIDQDNWRDYTRAAINGIEDAAPEEIDTAD